MKLQSYKDGEIHKVGKKYQFVKNGKVKGTYDSVDALVKAQEKPDTTKDEEPDQK